MHASKWHKVVKSCKSDKSITITQCEYTIICPKSETAEKNVQTTWAPLQGEPGKWCFTSVEDTVQWFPNNIVDAVQVQFEMSIMVLVEMNIKTQTLKFKAWTRYVGIKRHSIRYCPHLWAPSLQPFHPIQQSHWLLDNYNDPVLFLKGMSDHRHWLCWELWIGCSGWICTYGQYPIHPIWLPF